MYRKLTLLIIAVLVQVAVFAQTGSFNEYVRPDEFQQKLKTTKDAVLLDVRTPEEVQQGYIKGSVNIDFKASDFKEKISKLDKNKTYFLYCAAGGRSGKTADMMEEMGFRKIYNLMGGIDAWGEEKLPVEKKE